MLCSGQEVTSTAHLLASAGMDKTVYIWNVWSEQQKKARAFTYHNAAVKDVRWSPQGNFILSCGYDCSSRLVDVEKGTESQVFSEDQAVTSIKFHPHNPNLFISGGSKGFLKLWDIRAGKTVHEYVRQLGPILDVEFMVDGKRFVSSSDVSKSNLSENSIIVWDVSREVPLSNQVYVEAYTCPCVRVHPSEPSFVAQSNGNYIAIFSTKHPFKLDKYKRYESHDVLGFPIKCGFSADGEILASGSSDGCIYFYHVKSSNTMRKIKVFDQPCIDVDFHPLMPNVIACGSWSGNVSVIDSLSLHEDKALLELHSFNRNEKDSAAVSSEKVETLKCVEPSTWPIKVKCCESNVLIRYPEVVLCVEIYHHEKTWKKTQEILVLGRQTLTELRDKIDCLTDKAIQKAVDYNSEMMYDPSGYFLIEEFFCNDMRHPNAINYSEPILDWLKNSEGEAVAKWDHILSDVGKARKFFLDKKPSSKLPNFRSVNMAKTRFCDLGFRLGAGYLYCHQGDCKHVLVIRDMRLVHPDDVQNRAAYPLIVHEPKKILKKCYVCNIYKAEKVTLDDKMAGENPCYFCLTCYYLLHYSEDGQLLHRDFKVYDYLQDY